MDLDYRASIVVQDVRAGRTPTPEYSEAMCELHKLKNSGVGSTDITLVEEIHNDTLQRELIEALLLAGADPSDVHEVFGVPVKVYQWFRQLYFEIDVFLTKLSKVSYVEQCQNPAARELKQRALNLGADYIYFTYGNMIPRTAAQKEIVRRMFLVSAYKAMAMNYNPLTSKVTKEALQHAKFMVQAFEALEKFDNTDNTGQLTLLHIITESPSGDATPVPTEDIV